MEKLWSAKYFVLKGRRYEWQKKRYSDPPLSVGKMCEVAFWPPWNFLILFWPPRNFEISFWPPWNHEILYYLLVNIKVLVNISG